MKGRTTQTDYQELSDSQLLDAFTEFRDERAFGELVSRHGPVVMSVCRRRLRNEHDCQDAFQATFLTLVTKAAWIREKSSVAGWLQRVAVAISINLHRSNSRQPVEADVDDVTSERNVDIEQTLMIEEELARLPANYRNAIVLCHLEGHKSTDAAEILGVPRNTLKSWLVRGREMMRKRLVKQGVSLSIGGLISSFVSPGGTSTVEASLIQETSRAASLYASGQMASTASAATLAKATITKMLLTKISTLTASATLIAAMILGLLVSVTRESNAQTPVLVDDFKTGDDGWRPFDLLGGPVNGGPGIFDASTGEYTLTSTGLVPPVGPQALYAEWKSSSEQRFSDGFLRATVRANNEDSFALLAMRVDIEESTLYQFGASAATNNFTVGVRAPDGSGLRYLGVITDLSFDAGEEWIMEAGTVGDRISLKVWQSGDPEPASPQLVATDSSIRSGSFGLVGDVSGSAAGPAFLSVTFDDVQFTPVPESSGLALSAFGLLGFLTLYRSKR